MHELYLKKSCVNLKSSCVAAHLLAKNVGSKHAVAEAVLLAKNVLVTVTVGDFIYN